MAADFLTTTVESTKDKSTQSSAKTTTNSDTKLDKPSLFDNILKTVQEDSKSSTEETSKDIKTTVKENTSKTTPSTKTTSTKSTEATTKTVSSTSTTKQDVKTTSLLDKMIIDAKQTIDSTKEESINKDIVKVSSKSTTTDDKLSSAIKNTKDVKVSTKDNIVKNNTEKSVKDKSNLSTNSNKLKDTTVDIKNSTTNDKVKIVLDNSNVDIKNDTTIDINTKELKTAKKEDISTNSTNIKQTTKEQTTSVKQQASNSIIDKKDDSTNIQKVDTVKTKDIKSTSKVTSSNSTLKSDTVKSKDTKENIVKNDSTSIVKEDIKKTTNKAVEQKVIPKEDTSEDLTLKDSSYSLDDLDSTIISIIDDEEAISTKSTKPNPEAVKNNKIEKTTSKKVASTDDVDNIQKIIDIDTDININSDKIDNKSQENISKSKEDTKQASLFTNITDNLPQQTSSTKQVNSSSKDIKKQNDNKAMLANIFLGSQKSSDNINKIQKITEAKEILKEDKSTKGVKKSAKKLNLNLTDVKVEQTKGEAKDVSMAQQTQIKSINQFLDKLILNPNSNMQQNNPSLDSTVFPTASKVMQKAQDSSQNISTTSSDIEESTVQVNVPSSVVQAFTTKVIGARQQVSSFMSDLSRSMYQNYKPPVTAFRLNLNPDSLGNISVVLKSNKADKTMNVSMNMSNSTTLDAFVDNKSALHSALQKTFTDSASTVSLDFGMQNESSNQSFEQSKQEQQQFVSGDTKIEVSKAVEEDENTASQDYM